MLEDLNVQFLMENRMSIELSAGDRTDCGWNDNGRRRQTMADPIDNSHMPPDV